MKVLVGLGNPGREYANTPHNVGFDVVDELAHRLAVDWKDAARFHALAAKSEFAGDTLWLLKPQTFMNASGEAVGPFLHYYHATPADLVVVEDDVNLPFGKLRVRAGGSSGGHHGLDSLIQHVGTDAFARIRLGMGRPEHGDLVAKVLGHIAETQRPLLRKLIAAAADAALCIAEHGLNEAMNRYNSWSAEATPA